MDIPAPRFAAISEHGIASLVETFYARVRHDPVLGPVFGQKLHDDADWAAHLARLRDFWSSVMLTSGRYKGDPFSAHLRVDGIEPEMFARWLGLFHQTCAELFVPDAADAFHGKAERIAQSLTIGLFERLPASYPAGSGA